MSLLFQFIITIGHWFDKLKKSKLKDQAYRNIEINRLAKQLQEEADQFYSQVK